MATIQTDRLERAIEQTRDALAELEALRGEYAALREQAPELLGLTEAAGMIGVRPDSFSRMRREGRIPAPIAELASGPVWLRAQFTFPNTLKESSG